MPKTCPDKPKRPLNAYACFSSEQARSMQGVKLASIAKACSEKWAAMSQEEKQVYEDKARADKQRYLKEMKHYNGRNRRTKKSKHPKNAFMHYFAAIRRTIVQEHPEWPVYEVSKEAGRRWRNLSDAEKQKYIKMAKTERNQYYKNNKQSGV